MPCRSLGRGGSAVWRAKDSVIAAPQAGRAAGTPGVDYSTTNVQEEGVDEPDLVKSNGSTLFVVRSDRLFAVDVRARKPRLAGSLQLPQTGSYELLLHGARLLVLSHGGAYAIDTRRRARSIRSHTVPFEPDRGRRQRPRGDEDSAQPRARRRLRQRPPRRDDRAGRDRLQHAAAAAVQGAGEGTPEASAAARVSNRALVRTSRIGSWLPSYRVKGRRGETLLRRRLVQCRNVRRPAVYSGLGLLTVLTIDLRKGLAPIDSDSIVADGRTVYASQKSLYVATQRWFAQPVSTTSDPPRVTTAIHKFDISIRARPNTGAAAPCRAT